MLVKLLFVINEFENLNIMKLDKNKVSNILQHPQIKRMSIELRKCYLFSLIDLNML